MGEAILGGAGGSGSQAGKIYKWKRYELNSETRYTWDKYSAVQQTVYKWNRYSYSSEYTWNKWSIGINWVEREHWGSRSVTHTADGRLSTSGQIYYFSNHPAVIGGSYGTTSSYYYQKKEGEWATNTYNANYFYYQGDTIHSFNYVVTGITSLYGTKMSDKEDTWYNVTAVGSHWFDIGSEDGRGTTSYGTVTSTYINDYPNGGVKDGFWYDSRTSRDIIGSLLGQVEAINNSGAYPPNGVSGSYWYIAAGSSISWAKSGDLIETVESTTTGTYPPEGQQDGFWYENFSSYIHYSMGSWRDYVYATREDMYPENGMLGNWWYIYEGEMD